MRPPASVPKPRCLRSTLDRKAEECVNAVLRNMTDNIASGTRDLREAFAKRHPLGERAMRQGSVPPKSGVCTRACTHRGCVRKRPVALTYFRFTTLS
jgi:hypothetical protein